MMILDPSKRVLMSQLKPNELIRFSLLEGCPDIFTQLYISVTWLPVYTTLKLQSKLAIRAGVCMCVCESV